MMTQTLISLVIKTSAGDREAFEQLLLSQTRNIINTIRKMAFGPEDEDDILQEISLRLFQHIASLREPEAFYSWLHKLIVNECLRHLEENKPPDSGEGLTTADDLFVETDIDFIPQAYMEKLELYTELTSAIKSMPKSIQKVIQLHYCNGMRHRDIAVLMGVTEGAVSVTLFRARNRLRKKLRR